MRLFCKSREGYNILVGILGQSKETQKWVFIKNKPHFMRIVGGYGIQRYLTDEKGKNHDIRELFRQHPDTLTIFPDEENQKVYFAVGRDWLEHEHQGNYGDGLQIFLSLDYMTTASQARSRGAAALLKDSPPFLGCRAFL